MPARFFAFSATSREACNAGASGHHGLAAGKSAKPGGHNCGISGDDSDIFRRKSKFIRANLCQRRRKSLSHRRSAGEDGDAARSADAHQRHFKRPASGALQAMREAHADEATRFTRFVVDGRGTDRQPARSSSIACGLRVIATVKYDCGAGTRLQRQFVWHPLGRNQISPAQFGRLDF